MRSLAATMLAFLALSAPAFAAPPTTGFEDSNGADWTTHEQELAFLAAVQAGSPRARVNAIGTTKQGRPLHVVEVSDPGPVGAEGARGRPTVLLTCSQHGNEPSGREACLKLLRDLAFATDPSLTTLLGRTTWLFIPSANPDGRAANTRENTDPTDINRDHLTLATPEARAVAGVVRDFQPDVAIDLHEYGPSQPVVYDDSVLWLWPRNLNTDAKVHDLAVDLGRNYLVPAANAAGYTTDEYGQAEVADNDVQQTAGDADEGIMRNLMGLRHVLGILVETRVDADVRQSPTEPADSAEVQRRRVDSHSAVLGGLVKFMTERGAEAAQVTSDAALRKAAEGAARGAPVYFGGADNQEPTAEQTVNPPMCGYSLTEEQVTTLGPRLDLQGISLFRPAGSGPFVPMGQRSEPLIPLLLDARGTRHVLEAKALDSCPEVPLPPAGGPAGPPVGPPVAPPAAACLQPRTLTLRIPRPKGRVLRTTVRANGKKVRVRKRIALVRLRKRGSTVTVRIVQRVRRGGKTRTRRTTRTYRVCP